MKIIKKFFNYIKLKFCFIFLMISVFMFGAIVVLSIKCPFNLAELKASGAINLLGSFFGSAVAVFSALTVFELNKNDKDVEHKNEKNFEAIKMLTEIPLSMFETKQIVEIFLDKTDDEILIKNVFNIKSRTFWILERCKQYCEFNSIEDITFEEIESKIEEFNELINSNVQRNCDNKLTDSNKATFINSMIDELEKMNTLIKKEQGKIVKIKHS